MDRRSKITMSKQKNMENGEQRIQIEIEDNDGLIIFRGSMNLENFAKVITGSANQIIDREI